MKILVAVMMILASTIYSADVTATGKVIYVKKFVTGNCSDIVIVNIDRDNRPEIDSRYFPADDKSTLSLMLTSKTTGLSIEHTSDDQVYNTECGGFKLTNLKLLAQ